MSNVEYIDNFIKFHSLFIPILDKCSCLTDAHLDLPFACSKLKFSGVERAFQILLSDCFELLCLRIYTLIKAFT